MVSASEDEFVPVCLGDPASEVRVDDAANAVKKAGAVFVWHRQAAGIRGGQGDVFLASRWDFLLELAHCGELEQWTRGDLGSIGLLVPFWHGYVGRRTRNETLVAFLHGRKEVPVTPPTWQYSTIAR